MIDIIVLIIVGTGSLSIGYYIGLTCGKRWGKYQGRREVWNKVFDKIQKGGGAIDSRP